MTKREEREHLLKLLFCKDFHEMSEMQEQMEFYEEQQEITDTEGFLPVKEKFKQLLKVEGQIDMVLSEAASGWALGRIGKAELTILRIAVYEIMFDEDVPDRVAINEAVELSKRYGSDGSSSFVNGVLAKIVKK